MIISRGSRRPGLKLLGLLLLPLLALAWLTPCHADIHSASGACPHGDCCGSHSIPLLYADNPAPVVNHPVFHFHPIEEQPLPVILASGIDRPPRA